MIKPLKPDKYYYKLYQNYPNPFNPSTIVGYRLKERSHVNLSLYDIKGELVKVLVNNEKESGYHQEVFNGKEFSSGIYFIKFEAYVAGESSFFTDIKKIILLK